MTDEQQPAEYFDELCRGVGLAAIRFTPVLERLGWEKASGARTYLHATTIPTAVFIDFIDVACGLAGADAARERLLALGKTWGLDRVESLL